MTAMDLPRKPGLLGSSRSPNRTGAELIPSSKKSGAMSLPMILARFRRDMGSHMTSGPSEEWELARLEASLGHRIPAPFRTFLQELGGGLFYDRHEIFGAHRVQIHDIELVPSLLSIRSSLGAGFKDLVPFHRADGVVHLMELTTEENGPARIVSSPEGSNYPDFAEFLERIVI